MLTVSLMGFDLPIDATRVLRMVSRSVSKNVRKSNYHVLRSAGLSNANEL